MEAATIDGSTPGTLVHYRDFPSTLIATRPVDVWLPEDYGTASAERYPVIYMHDGQFMFDRSHSPYAGTTVAKNRVLLRLPGAEPFDVLTRPTALQREAF